MKKLKFIFAGAILLGSLASCEKEEVTTNEEEVQTTQTTKEQENAGFGRSLAQFKNVDEYIYTMDYRNTQNLFLRKFRRT